MIHADSVAANIGSAYANIAPLSGSISEDHDLIGGDPRLGPLQKNGGPTETMALLGNSPAIGQADGSAGLPATDQRGQTRTSPFGESTDIGAYEYS